MSQSFNLDRIVNDMQSGSVRGFEVRIDPAHNGRPEHIDLHVRFSDRNGVKYTGLGGADQLRSQMPWIQPGQPIDFGR